MTTAITVAIAGQILDRIGFHLHNQIVFLGLSMGGLISYYFSNRIQNPDTVPLESTNHHCLKSNVTEYYQLINSSPDFVTFTLERFVYLFGITLSTPLFPLYFVRELNASDAGIGLLYTAQTAVLVAGFFFWTRQSRRRGSRFVLLISTFCVSLYPGLVASTTNQTLVFIFSTAA